MLGSSKGIKGKLKKYDVVAVTRDGSNNPTGFVDMFGEAIPLGGSLPSNAVLIDPVTGLFKTQAGDSIAEGFVDTMVDALLLTGGAYDDQSLVVKNPGGNVSNYFPTKLFRLNSDWRTLGRSVLYKEVPRLRVTWPADAWDAGSFSKTSMDSGNQVLVESNPTTALHALTQAVQVTGGGSLGGSYVYITGSTGAGTVDWQVGLVKIADIPSDYGLTLIHPFNAGLRTPVFATSGTSSPIIVRRISAPPLSINGGFEVTCTGQNTKNTNQHKLRVRYGAAGCTIASGSNIIGDTSTSTLASPFHHRCGIMNAGSTSVNVTTGPIDDADGWAYGTSGDVYGAYAVSNGSANTDILICLESSNAADIVMELVAVEVEWWR